MRGRAGPAGRRRALCVGLTTFGQHRGEPPAGTPAGLPYAGERVEGLEKVLVSGGYDCTVLDGQALPTAEALGDAVRAVLSEGTTGDVQVVHVLSHGHLAPGGVYVVGADGLYAPGTKVQEWVAHIEDFAELPRAHTLFLVDTCHAGQAARLNWLPAAGAATRAWVIAATPAHGLAYNGWFTQAVTNVLTRLHAGEIDFYPGEYVPFGHVVEHIRREVAVLGGDRQAVCSTPVDGQPDPPPFFPNPRPAEAGSLSALREELDAAAEPLLDLDAALDAAHFLDRAAGHRPEPGTGRVGCFVGRERELQGLADWLTPAGEGGLRLVTGGAGSGKSAVLGILMCAVHPRLREATRHLWEAASASMPRWNGALAAVHLREQDLAGVTAALVRQLGLDLDPSRATPAEVVALTGRFACPPLLVLDALDEAVDQERIQEELLLPLAGAARSDGTPACRLVIGTRPWEQFQPLLALAQERGGLVDLDTVPADRLRGELGRYVADLLSLAPAFESGRMLPARRALAHGVARTLTEGGGQRGGEFLSAALFTNWVVRGHPDGLAPAEAARLALQVPRGVPDVLELDLRGRTGQRRLRPVLTALAHACGAGMPATVVRRVAVAAAGAREPGAPSEDGLSAAEFEDVLRQVRFYLRSSPDTDGTTLYRLFHQSLVDHLRQDRVDLDLFHDRLTAPAPPDATGARRWDAAEPYVVRHAAQHAAEAGRLDELLHVAPHVVRSLFNTVTGPRGRLAAAVYRLSADRPPTPPDPVTARRDLQALDAARFGARGLLERLTARAPSGHWLPRWATGGQLPSAQRAVLLGHTDTVRAVACAQVRGGPVAVSAGDDMTLRVWDLVTCAAVRAPLTGHDAQVSAVACGEWAGRPVAVSGDTGGGIRLWDLDGGSSHAFASLSASVTSLAFGVVRGRTVVIAGGTTDAILVHDIEDGSLVRRLALGEGASVGALAYEERDGLLVACLQRHDHHYRLVAWDCAGWDVVTDADLSPLSWGTALACTALNGRTACVTGHFRGQVQRWQLAGGARVGDPLSGHEDVVYGLAVTASGGRTLAVTAGNDATVRTWDLERGERAAETLLGHQGPVNTVACTAVEGRPVAVTGGSDGTVRLWDLAGDDRLGDPLPGHRDVVNGLACAVLDGRDIAVTVSSDGTAAVWDVELGLPVRRLECSTGWLHDVACTVLEGRVLAVTVGRDGSVRVLELGSGQQVRAPYTAHGCAVAAVACTRVDGSATAVTAGFDGTVRMWPVLDRRRGRDVVLRGHESAVTAVDCAALGRRPVAVTGGHDGTVRVWDLREGRQSGRPLDRHRGPVSAVACGLLDGRPVAVTGGHDRTVRIWDLATRQALGGPLWGHRGTVTSVACTTAGGRLAVVTGSADRTVRTWDAATGAQTAVSPMPYPVNAVAVTHGGDLVAGSGWETVCLGRGGGRTEKEAR
ncbi:AAA family ATPase [Streptomyces sp. NPDC090108]|uniref:AAA family ATPase n=1 Tax=Streptomyces sp. NPDC090108 TaxID=3365947 RepID=UPI003808058A